MATEIGIFFSEAISRTSPSNLDGILKLATECALYFNEHKETLYQLAQKLTFIIDSVYPRTKGAPSFENYVWGFALITSAWNGWLREAKVIDRNSEPERKLLINTVIPSLSSVAEIGRKYAQAGIRHMEDLC